MRKTSKKALNKLKPVSKKQSEEFQENLKMRRNRILSVPALEYTSEMYRNGVTVGGRHSMNRKTTLFMKLVAGILCYLATCGVMDARLCTNQKSIFTTKTGIVTDGSGRSYPRHSKCEWLIRGKLRQNFIFLRDDNILALLVSH